MLTEREAAGVVGEGRADELRGALVDVREILRAETEAAAPQYDEPETTGSEETIDEKVRSVSIIAFGNTLKMLMRGTPVNGFVLEVSGRLGGVYVQEIHTNEAET